MVITKNRLWFVFISIVRLWRILFSLFHLLHSLSYVHFQLTIFTISFIHSFWNSLWFSLSSKRSFTFTLYLRNRKKTTTRKKKNFVCLFNNSNSARICCIAMQMNQKTFSIVAIYSFSFNFSKKPISTERNIETQTRFKKRALTSAYNTKIPNWIYVCVCVYLEITNGYICAQFL